MKLRCIDGKVREFRKAGFSFVGGWYEGKCYECGEEFGVRDTKNLKPLFKKHICKLDEKK